MKKLLIVLPITFMFVMASCGGCNTSSASGAADCACDYTKEMVDAVKDGDEDALKDISKKMESLKEEVDGHIEAGDYTENDLEAELEKLEGECGDL